ncbi:hypothetical protein [Geomicrobium sp. JCM 19039]|uniref:hypothetical protein n=1 Tax=Geomicrobium sp. JCM 19039 TaxID=1460636 RepID=UPI0005A6A3C9|nr:hypothetical protein [Geomicrobium sp. JCM 19039]
MSDDNHLTTKDPYSWVTKMRIALFSIGVIVLILFSFEIIPGSLALTIVAIMLSVIIVTFIITAIHKRSSS